MHRNRLGHRRLLIVEDDTDLRHLYRFQLEEMYQSDWIDCVADGAEALFTMGALRQMPDEEVSSLVRALDQFTHRLEHFIERERLFTRDASHELRTPIAVLRSAMELLERRYNVEDDKTIRRIYRTLYDMESLIETLLILAREQEDSLPSNQVAVNELIKDEIDTLKLLFQDKAVNVEIESDNNLTLSAPERVLKILIGNLLRNAFNYTPRGTIYIKTWSQGFSVRDSGVGMDSEQVKQVFKPFYRAESSGNGYGR